MFSHLPRLHTKHAFITLILTGLLLYIHTLSRQMFWDDDDFILNNIFIRDWRFLTQFFTQNLIAGSGLISNYYRPVLLIVFALQYHLWGFWSPGYHFINLSFHIADTLLLFIFLRLLLSRLHLPKHHLQLTAFLTSLIFLIHPLQTEAVTYVNSLGDSLSVFFILISLLLFIRSLNYQTSQNRFFLFFGLSLFSATLALLSKETSIILPGLIILTYPFITKPKTGFSRLKTYLVQYAALSTPFILTSLIYLLLRLTLLNFNDTLNIYGFENPYTQNFSIRAFTFFKVLLIYLRLMIVPTHLHMERTTTLETTLLSPLPFLGFLLLIIAFLILIVFALRLFRHHSRSPLYPLTIFGLGWFAITLFPTSNLVVPVSGLLYEHWLYLPLVGFFLILSYLLVIIATKIINSTHPHRPKFLFTFYFLLSTYLLFLSYQTIRRNFQWLNPITFYHQTLSYNPTSYRVTNNLGMEYDQIGDHPNAQKFYLQAVDLDPHNPVAYHNLGNLHKNLNQPDQAIDYFTQAITLDPSFSYSYRALATLYFNQSRFADAKSVLESYLSHHPPSLDILISLSTICSALDDYPAALDYIQTARNLDPHHPYLIDQERYLRQHLSTLSP